MKPIQSNRYAGGQPRAIHGFGFAARFFPKATDTRLTEFFFKKIPAYAKNRVIEEKPGSFKPKNTE